MTYYFGAFNLAAAIVVAFGSFIQGNYGMMLFGIAVMFAWFPLMILAIYRDVERGEKE